MQQLLYLAAALACPIGMGLMMWLMMRGMGGKQQQPRDAGQASARHDALVLTPEEKLAVLRERKRRVESEICTLQEGEVRPSRN